MPEPIVLLDEPEDVFCESLGWVSTDVPENDARDLLAPYCADENGARPARPVGEARRVWLSTEDPATDEQLWNPCEPGEGTEFWEFDATDVQAVAAGA